MGASGGGGSGDGTNTIRYAPYIEDRHKAFLTTSASAGATARGANPYEDYDDIDFADGFFGSGYTIASFPSLYDMYGKFMAGLDVEALWTQSVSNVQSNLAINELISDQVDILNNQYESESLPRLETGLRDINAVMSSSFAIAKSNLEVNLTRDINKFSSELRYKLIPVAVDLWAKHMMWNQNVIQTYISVMTTAINTKFAEDDRNFDMATKNVLWPFTVLDFERANIGAMQGAITGRQGSAGASQAQRSVSGALGGASMGAAVGGPWGAAVGGLLGFASSFF